MEKGLERFSNVPSVEKGWGGGNLLFPTIFTHISFEIFNLATTCILRQVATFTAPGIQRNKNKIPTAITFCMTFLKIV